jgi:predicted transcriptional regulator of viral defense system
MSLNNLLKVGAVALPKVEQAAAWMIGQGPIIEHPELPAWVLRTLVRQHRVARLRRGVYAVPDAQGRLRLSPFAVGEVVEPGSVLSFHAALAFWNVTDQTPRRVGVVSKKRHSRVAFGSQTVVFLARPRALRHMEIKRSKVGDQTVRVATPAQAFIDALSYPPLAVSPAEMLTILAHGLATQIFTPTGLRRRALADGSLVVARRLGLLLELATGETDSALLERARSSHAYSSFDGPEDHRATHAVPRWLLRIAAAPERMQAAAGVRISATEA